MAGKILKSLVALALVGSSVPSVAQGESTIAESQAEGIGLWFGVLMSLVVLGIVVWHGKIFDDDDLDEPVSP